MDSESFHQLEELFVHAGAAMNVVHEYDILLSILNFVSMGSGCSILPDYARAILGGVVYKPLRPPNVVRNLAMIKRKGRGDLAEAFYRFTIDNLPRWDPEQRTGMRRKRTLA
jgi:DNA-binding transcriptional LysR family regulator